MLLAAPPPVISGAEGAGKRALNKGCTVTMFSPFLASMLTSTYKFETLTGLSAEGKEARPIR